MLRLLIIFIIGFCLAACDTVESEYATLADARKDELFGRGWLPDILPSTAYKIRVANDLNLNISEGQFRFDPKDAQLLKAKLAASATSPAPFVGWDKTLEKKRKDGFEPGSYFEGRTTWVFVCEYGNGICEYVMWLSRDS